MKTQLLKSIWFVAMGALVACGGKNNNTELYKAQLTAKMVGVANKVSNVRGIKKLVSGRGATNIDITMQPLNMSGGYFMRDQIQLELQECDRASSVGTFQQQVTMFAQCVTMAMQDQDPINTYLYRNLASSQQGQGYPYSNGQLAWQYSSFWRPDMQQSFGFDQYAYAAQYLGQNPQLSSSNFPNMLNMYLSNGYAPQSWQASPTTIPYQFQ